MTPKESMREYCKQCLNLTQFSTEKVKNCGGDTAGCGACPIYPHRLKRISVKTFRKNCLYCMGGPRKLVDECEIKDCPAWVYRFGKNPAIKNKGNPNIGKICSQRGSFQGVFI